jgi:hypothetical protein
VENTRALLTVMLREHEYVEVCLCGTQYMNVVEFVALAEKSHFKT